MSTESIISPITETNYASVNEFAKRFGKQTKYHSSASIPDKSEVHSSVAFAVRSVRNENNEPVPNFLVAHKDDDGKWRNTMIDGEDIEPESQLYCYAVSITTYGVIEKGHDANVSFRGKVGRDSIRLYATVESAEFNSDGRMINGELVLFNNRIDKDMNMFPVVSDVIGLSNENILNAVMQYINAYNDGRKPEVSFAGDVMKRYRKQQKKRKGA